MYSEESLVKKNRRERRGSFSPETKQGKSRYDDSYTPRRKYLYDDFVIPEYNAKDISIKTHNVCADYSEKVIKAAINKYINNKTI